MTLIDTARNRWACKDSDWFVDQFDVRIVERIESCGDWVDDIDVDFAQGKEVSSTDFDFELRFPFVAQSKEPSNCADMPRITPISGLIALQFDGGECIFDIVDVPDDPDGDYGHGLGGP